MYEEVISERNREILKAVVTGFIQTAEPVGSRTIAKKYSNKLSPATVRNVMADLEEVGYLRQPHTSAGRVPTEKGLRFYVDSLLEIRKLSKSEKEKIKNKYNLSKLEIQDILKETSKVLSSLSRHTAVVISPKFPVTVFKYIEFIKISENRILVIFVTQSGVVQNKIIEDEEELTQDDLNKMSNYLNDMLKNLTLIQVREKIFDEMRNEKIMYDKIISQALKMSQKIISDEQDTDVYVDGKLSILEQPEFSDFYKLKVLLKAFEEKSLLIKLLDKSMKAEGVQIFIGSESELDEMKGCSIIASTYHKESNIIGSLGVIGPTRMNYSRVIPIVDYTAELLTEFLNIYID